MNARLGRYVGGVPVYMLLIFLGVGSLEKSALGFDLDYSVSRYWDSSTSEYVTVISNYYEEDSLGNPIYKYQLPIYVGPNPSMDDVYYLTPGYQVEVRSGGGDNMDSGGFGSGVGGKAKIGDRKALPNHPQDPRWEGYLIGFKNKKDENSPPLTIQDWPDDIKTYVEKVNGYDKNGNPIWGPRVRAAKGQNLGRGCFRFTADEYYEGRRLQLCGCEVFLSDEANQPLSGLCYMNPATEWPGVAPSFFSDKDWMTLFLGDTLGNDGGTVPGIGTVEVECDAAEFMSVYTPEAYMGCPEPATLTLLVIGGLASLPLLRRRIKGRRP